MIPQPIDTVPLFQRLSGEERQRIIARLKQRQVAAGEAIITEGALADHLYIIIAGWVKLESGTVNRAVTLANLGAGSLIGDNDMLLGQPYSMTARAAANTQLLALARADLADLIDECPSIGLKFSASLGVRLAFLENHLVQQRLRNIPLLSALSESDLRAIAQQLEFRSVNRGDILVEVGDPGDAVFIVEEGQVRLMTRSAEGEAFEDLAPGAIFGHAAMLTGKTYQATARAVTDVTVWTLARPDYQQIVRTHPAVKLALSRALAESLSARDQAGAVERLRQLPIFADVPADALSMLAARLVLRHIPSEEVIYTEGTPGDAMYIVDSGQVRLLDSAFSDAQLLERLQPGEAFGEMALLTGRTRAECARAATDATIWVLYKTDFDDLMVQYPEISVSLSRVLTKRLASRESDFVIRHLRRLTLFSNLATSELKAISKRVRGLRFRPGEIICFAGQPAQTLYLIEKGEIKRLLNGPAGAPIMLDILDAGDSFGEQELVQNIATVATAQAMTDAELWTISKDDFRAMMEQYPPLALSVSQVVTNRVNRLQRVIASVQGRPGAGTPASRPGQPAPQPRPAPIAPPPQPRIQRQPSGARPVANRPTTQPQPQPRPASPKPIVTNSAPATNPVAASVANPPMPTPRVPAMPKTIAREKPATMPAAQPRRRQGSFFKEFGGWVSGLSFGGKLRALTLGALAVWFLLVALPWMTITTVSSAVGGLQLFNADDTTTTANAAAKDSNPLGGGRPKVAFVVPTNTPLPTRTPQPTYTPRPQPTRVLPTRTPMPVAPVAAAVAPAPTLPPPFIDPRVGNGPQVLPHLDKVKIIPAAVAHGQKFWRVTSLKFEDITESGNDHTIYVKIFDENGKRTEAKVKWWGEGSGDLPDPEQKSASDICDCNYGLFMFGDGYGVKIVDQYPSDQVTGMIMPMRRHVNYKIQYQLTTMP